MAKARIDITDQEIDEAILAGQMAEPHMIRGLSVQYFPEEDVFYFTFVNHGPVVVPRKWLQGLDHVSQSEAASCELDRFGEGVHWPALDVDHLVEAIARGTFGNQRWMRDLDKHRATLVREHKSDQILA